MSKCPTEALSCPSKAKILTEPRMNRNVKENILQIYSSKLDFRFHIILYHLQIQHLEFPMDNIFVEPFEVKNKTKLARRPELGHTKVRIYTLTFWMIINHCHSTFSYQV